MSDVDQTARVVMILGYNELAKRGGTLAEKVYWRLAREEARRAFIANGGTVESWNAPGETIVLPSRPSLTFYEKDIEDMRAIVFAHDVKTGRVCKHGMRFKAECIACLEEEP